MYQPAHFQQTDPQALARLMAEHSLATLVHQDATGDLCADLLPMMWQPSGDGQRGLLRGHVARANPLWQQADGQAVLAVFQGPQAYISPSWYATKARTGQVVPTWNYAVVQAHGRLRSLTGRDELLALVSQLTERHEEPRPQPWAVADAPADYVERLLAAIVGIEVQVERLEGKWKLSQNRPQADRQGVQAGLQGEAEPDAQRMAEWLQRIEAGPA